MSQILSDYSPYIALAIMALTFVSFILERYPPEVTAAMGAAGFVVTGLVSTPEAFSVFSNPAPLTIAAMFVLTGALVRTGLIERLAGVILDFAGDRAWLAIISLFMGILAIGGFINNTPLVLVMIPVTLKLCERFGITPTRMLIPVSYITILAGTLTLIGTSTNLLVDGVARESGIAPFGIFEITPVGIVTALSGIALLALFGRFLLPDREQKKVGAAADSLDYLTDILILEEGPFTESPVGEVKALKLSNLKLRGIRRGGKMLREGVEDRKLRKGDTLVVSATAAELLTLQAHKHVRVGLRGDERLGGETTIAETLVAPQKAIVGSSVSDLSLGGGHGIRVMGIHRHNHIAGRDLRSSKLRAADRLLVQGPVAAIGELAEQGYLISAAHTTARAYRRTKAPLAILALLGVVALSALGVMDIGILAMLAVAVILVLRCIDADEAWEAIDAGILVMIFSMLIVGVGLQRSGAIDLIVGQVTPFLGGLSPLMLLVVVYLLASFLTELISSSAVAVIMTPIAIGIAESIGVDPRPLLVAVMFAASASFATPIGYQTNTLVYAAGNYTFMDFVKVGMPMNIVVGFATCIAIRFLYGL